MQAFSPATLIKSNFLGKRTSSSDAAECYLLLFSFERGGGGFGHLA